MEKQQVSHTVFGSPVALDCSTEIPGNFSVPKSNIQIKSAWVLENKPVQFCFVNW